MLAAMRFGLALPQYGFSLPTGRIRSDDAVRWAACLPGHPNRALARQDRNLFVQISPSRVGKVDGIIGGYRNVEAIQIAQESGQKPTVFPASALGVPSYAELVLVAWAHGPRHAHHLPAQGHGRRAAGT